MRSPATTWSVRSNPCSVAPKQVPYPSLPSSVTKAPSISLLWLFPFNPASPGFEWIIFQHRPQRQNTRHKESKADLRRPRNPQLFRGGLPLDGAFSCFAGEEILRPTNRSLKRRVKRGAWLPFDKGSWILPKAKD